MFKTLFFLVLLFPAYSFAQLQNTYYFTASLECYVKEHKLGELIPVSEKPFKGIGLKAVKLKRNPQFMAFKLSGKVYLAPSKCMTSQDYEIPEELDERAFDVEQNNSSRRYEESSRPRERDYNEPSSSSSDFNFSRNKYYIELNGGAVNVGGEEATYPNYKKEFDGIRGDYDEDGIDDGTIQTGKIKGSEYKAKSSFSLGFGWRSSDVQFYTFRVRKFSGSKSDIIPFVYNFDNGDIGNGDFIYNFKDSYLEFLIGTKFLFLPSSSLKPFVSAFLGMSTMKSEFSQYGEKLLDLKSSGLALMLEGGFEYLFTSHVGLVSTIGYEYQGKRKFTIGDKVAGTENTYNGFKSNMAYSNTYLTLGLIFYFN